MVSIFCLCFLVILNTFSKLIIWVDKFRTLGQQFLPNKVVVNLYMFGSFMKYWIGSNMKSCLVVTIQLHLFNFTKLQLLKLFDPNLLTSGCGYSPIFCSCTRPSNNVLFLAPPRDNIASNGYKISSSRSFVYGVSSPISITIPKDLGIFFVLI